MASTPSSTSALVRKVDAHLALGDIRQQMGIPSDWRYSLVLRSPEEMPLCFGRCSWDYLANRSFQIEVRSDLDGAELAWVLCHELYESLLAALSDFGADLIDKLYGPAARHPNTDAALLLHARQSFLNDELIERLVRLTLQTERPETLDALHHLEKAG